MLGQVRGGAILAYTNVLGRLGGRRNGCIQRQRQGYSAGARQQGSARGPCRQAGAAARSGGPGGGRPWRRGPGRAVRCHGPGAGPQRRRGRGRAVGEDRRLGKLRRGHSLVALRGYGNRRVPEDARRQPDGIGVRGASRPPRHAPAGLGRDRQHSQHSRACRLPDPDGLRREQGGAAYLWGGAQEGAAGQRRARLPGAAHGREHRRFSAHPHPRVSVSQADYLAAARPGDRGSGGGPLPGAALGAQHTPRVAGQGHPGGRRARPPSNRRPERLYRSPRRKGGRVESPVDNHFEAPFSGHDLRGAGRRSDDDPTPHPDE
jgi:hypothetical protein